MTPERLKSFGYFRIASDKQAYQLIRREIKQQLNDLQRTGEIDKHRSVVMSNIKPGKWARFLKPVPPYCLEKRLTVYHGDVQ